MKNAILLLIATITLSACSVVAPTERGVRYSMGKVDGALAAGTHFWFPYFAGIQTIDVSVHAVEIPTNAGTKDQQEVSTLAVVNIQADPEKVLEIVNTYGSEEAMFKQIIPQIHEAINANVSKFSAEEVLTKRTELKKDIDAMIKERAAKYGAHVFDISLKDLRYSKEYADAVERKQVAEQQAKQAEYNAVKAEKDATAAVNKAKGVAESQKLMRSTITAELLQQQAIEKWDGKFPQFMGGNGSLPFINFTPSK